MTSRTDYYCRTTALANTSWLSDVSDYDKTSSKSLKSLARQHDSRYVDESEEDSVFAPLGAYSSYTADKSLVECSPESVYEGPSVCSTSSPSDTQTPALTTPGSGVSVWNAKEVSEDLSNWKYDNELERAKEAFFSLAPTAAPKNIYNSYNCPATPEKFCNDYQDDTVTLKHSMVPTLRVSRNSITTPVQSYKPKEVAKANSVKNADRSIRLAVEGLRIIKSSKVTQPDDDADSLSRPRRALISETTTSPFVKKWVHLPKREVITPKTREMPRLPHYSIIELRDDSFASFMRTSRRNPNSVLI